MRKKVNLPYDRSAEGRLYTVRQVAELIACSPSWVYRLVEDGRLKALRIGTRKGVRVTKGSVGAFMATL